MANSSSFAELPCLNPQAARSRQNIQNAASTVGEKMLENGQKWQNVAKGGQKWPKGSQKLAKMCKKKLKENFWPGSATLGNFWPLSAAPSCSCCFWLPLVAFEAKNEILLHGQSLDKLKFSMNQLSFFFPYCSFNSLVLYLFSPQASPLANA